MCIGMGMAVPLSAPLPAAGYAPGTKGPCGHDVPGHEKRAGPGNVGPPAAAVQIKWQPTAVGQTAVKQTKLVGKAPGPRCA